MIIDTNDSCRGKAQLLKNKDIDTVGRYYRMATHPEWAITKVEAQQLSRADIKIFVVFEDYGLASKLKLTIDQGKNGRHERIESSTGDRAAAGQRNLLCCRRSAIRIQEGRLARNQRLLFRCQTGYRRNV